MTFPTPLPTLKMISNPYSNWVANSFPTPSNTPSNGCSPTPHTPRALEAPLWALGPAAFRPLKGRDRKGPHYPRHASNRRFRTSSTAGTALDEQLPAEQLARGGFRHEVTVTSVTDRTVDHRNLLPGASHRSNRVTQPLEMLRFHPISRCLPIIGGIYARVAAASFTLVERKMRRRDRSRNLEMARYLGDGGQIDRRHGGVGPLPGPLAIIDLLSIFRGRFQKICCPLATQGLPIFGAARFENPGRP
jgi:hypothetical protein